MKPILYLLLFIALNARSQVINSDSLAFSAKISSATILGLGEPGHGYESVNEVKANLTRVLRANYKFEGIAFESSFTGSIIAYLENYGFEKRLGKFLYPFWNTETVRAGLAPFKEAEISVSKPLITGFDVQEDCRYVGLSSYLKSAGLVKENTAKLDKCDSILALYIGKNHSRRSELSEGEYQLLTDNYASVENEVARSAPDNFQKKLVIRCLENRKWLCKYLTIHDLGKRMYFRDSLMAENVSWLKEQVYGSTKFIIWAANLHIASGAAESEKRWMGERLSAMFGGAYLVVVVDKGVGRQKIALNGIEFKVDLREGNSYGIKVFVDRLQKIRKDEWITRCE